MIHLFVVYMMFSAVCDPTDKDFSRWVSQLSSSDFQVREVASKELIQAGRLSIPAVMEAAQASDAETRERGWGILIDLHDSPDDLTHDAARHAFQRLSKSEHPIAGRASEFLERPKKTLEWIRQHQGEYDVDVALDDRPVVVLRLDRTRGIDPGFRPDTIQDLDYKQLEVFRHLRDLTLEYRTTMTDDCLRFIGRLRKLSSLNLSRTRVNGSGLAHLTELPELRSLDLSRCAQFDDEGAAFLRDLKHLTTLRLDGYSNMGWADDLWKQNIGHRRSRRRQALAELRGGISDDGMQHIAELSNLRTLSIAKTRITDIGLLAIRQIPQLEWLDVSRTAITDEGLAHLTKNSKLRVLKLNLVQVSDEGLSKLKTLSQLEELELRGTNITDSGLRQLSGLTRLRKLDLSMTEIGDQAVEVLQSFPHLEELDLSQTSITLFGLTKLADTCRNIDLKNAFVAAGLGTLDKSGELTSLNLGGQKIGDRDLIALTGFHGLQSLQLTDTQISDDGLSHLRGLRQLKHLSLHNTRVTDDGLVHLENLTKLDTLPIRDTRITFSGMVNLIVERQNRSLEDAVQVARLNEADPLELKLSNLAITDADLQQVRTLKSPHSLFLNGNPVSDAGLAHVAHLDQLKLLWVSGEAITGDGLAHLKSLTRLETLWLTDTSIASDDLAHLKSWPLLRTINLSGTPLNDKAIQHLKSTKLETLIVDSLALTDEATEELHKANPALTIIHSQKCAIAAIRGHQRKYAVLPNGISRVREMGRVHTIVPRHDLISVFGDAYFEQANRLVFDGEADAQLHRWKELPTVTDVAVVSIRYPQEMVVALRDLSNLKRLSFYRSSVEDEDMAHVGKLTQLEDLDLQRTGVTDAALRHLKNLTLLKSLSLGGYGTAIRDPGMKHLENMSSLESLGLSRTDITDSALIHLKHLKHLKRLELREVRIDEGIQHISELKKLESIDLSSTFVSDSSIPHLTGLSGLKRISLENTMLTDEGVVELRKRLPRTQVSAYNLLDSEMQRVVSPLAKMRVPMFRNSSGVFMVDIRKVGDVKVIAPLLLQLNELKYLWLGSRASDQLLGEIAGVSSLERLDLSNSSVSAKGLSKLESLDRLQYLSLRHCKLSTDALRSLSKDHLKMLDLRDASLPKDGTGHLADLAALTWLNLSTTSINNQQLSSLAKIPGLNVLVLDNTSITNEGLMPLGEMINLRFLYLRNTNVNDVGARHLKKMLPSCSVILKDGHDNSIPNYVPYYSKTE